MWPKTVRKSDLRIEYMRGSGKGGQNRNKRDTACRMTHLPTGISVRAEEGRTQEVNKKLAFERLADKLIPLMKQDKPKEKVNLEEVRVYRETDDKVRDKRLQKTYSYKDVIKGRGLDSIIEDLENEEVGLDGKGSVC